jgi:hypothetical protein
LYALLLVLTLAPAIGYADSTNGNELGSSSRYPIVLHSKAEEEGVPDGKWVVDSIGTPWRSYSTRAATIGPVSPIAVFLVVGLITFLLWKAIFVWIRPRA